MPHLPPSDLELVDRLRSGDAAAAGLLTERHRPALIRYARSLLSHEAQAEEVVQEALARLTLENLPEGPPRPWFYRVTRNLCLDILRRRQISPTYGGGMATGFDPARNTAGPATRAARAERDELIRQILEGMPEDYRSVLMLKHFEDLSRTEIAQVLGLSEQTVKGRLVRASEYLRDELRRITGSIG